VEKNRLVNIAQIAHADHFHMMRAVTFHPDQPFEWKMSRAIVPPSAKTKLPLWRKTRQKFTSAV
jgi:hypothetical protein